MLQKLAGGGLVWTLSVVSKIRDGTCSEALRFIGLKPEYGGISTRNGAPSEKLFRGRTRMKRSLPEGSGWKACSGLIMADEYIRLSPKRMFGEQPRERDFAGLLIVKSAK